VAEHQLWREALAQSEDLKKDLRQRLARIRGAARSVDEDSKGWPAMWSTHRSGLVVIADQPLQEYVPLQRVADKEEVITQMGDGRRRAGPACVEDGLSWDYGT